MAKEIISFRPTGEVMEMIERARGEGRSVSKWINERLKGDKVAGGSASSICTFRFIPEERAEEFCPKEGNTFQKEYILTHSLSVSRLNLRQYDKFRQCLQRDGLEFYSRTITGFGVVQMVAVNETEANVEFQKYFTRLADGTYQRTELPLPTMRYDARTDTAIICYIDPV